jgi:hypothetical protein
MSSDRTRISYDQDRQYRSVVAQQGRVTLESDWNESQLIVNEEIRSEALDFVGSSGTPDNGYEIAASNPNPNVPFDFSIKKGTLYVGGIRTALNQAINYSQQNEKLDWLDRDPDSFPAWVNPASLADANPKTEFVYLYLQEQEISAVEDSVLKEIALGGPDTMQRTRLIQKIVRFGVQANDCETALILAKKEWRKQGLVFDDLTMRLESQTKLKVSFQPAPIPPDLCEPEARGGYLGAENQLIRVKISAAGKLIWGYDNASFLYRTKWINNNTLELQSRPVDAFHQPKKGKIVEVLRSIVDLKNKDYIAQSTGIITQLATAYSPDNKQVSLLSPLDDNYKNYPHQLFLRIWEQEISFTAGTEVTLGDTGIKVTIQTSANFHVGDYWQIAVRPASPNEIYPQRLESFQPPDGARIWVCPLAVISWNNGVFNLLKDCRHRFDNLVELTKRQLGSGCCTVVVKPADLNKNTTLQSIIDRYQNRERVTICLMPGKYLLSEPLLLDAKHSNLTIEGCHDGAILEVAPGEEPKFLQGLIVLKYANNITIRRIHFRLPLLKSSGGQSLQANTPQVLRSLNIASENFWTSIGIRALHCAVLTVEDCLFRYIIPEGADVFSVGIFAGSECWGLNVLNNRFLCDEAYLNYPRKHLRLLIGFLLMPAIAVQTRPRMVGSSSSSFVPSLLQDAVFSENLFSGLTIPIMNLADSGSIRIEKNIVRDSYSGFWLISPSFLLGFIKSNNLPLISTSMILALLFPLPSNFTLHPNVKLKLTNHKLIKRQIVDNLEDLDLGLISNNIRSKFARFVKKVSQQNSVLIEELSIQRLVFSLRISDNDIDANLAKVSSSIGLTILGDRSADRRISSDNPKNSLILSGNKIHNRPGQLPTVVTNRPRQLPTVLISDLTNCTIYGNIIFNESSLQGKISLVIKKSVAVAITGNVFKGNPVLPSRQAPAPLNTWEFLNTIIL